MWTFAIVSTDGDPEMLGLNLPTNLYSSQALAHYKCVCECLELGLVNPDRFMWDQAGLDWFELKLHDDCIKLYVYKMKIG